MIADRTRLYRAVRAAEAISLLDIGAFWNPPGSEVKYFARYRRGAVAYARLAAKYAEGTYYLFATWTETDRLLPEFELSLDNGIASVVLTTDLLASLSPPECLGDIDDGT